ncbi:hypothetical protein AVEN_175696-1 [Araneus ventricosus]|uniref:Uncharacterized protein n=1 Tax=Araneus ventricosus TaxID=182803 RepID=A0A4Y2F160_ARAVE|nr:hypothetical protein AVEN_175696-1 [Araneus ventricosus]
MFSRIENEHDFLNHNIFSEEATFHVGNKAQLRNLGLRKSPRFTGSERNSLKINLWCSLLHDTVIGYFSFAETFVTANIYLHTLQICAISQMQHLQLTVIFQQDAGARMFEHFARTGLPAGHPQAY